MTRDPIRDIADAVLYEGFMLYPYRPSSLKNRQRWTFGGLFPEALAKKNGDSSFLRAEMLVNASSQPRFEVIVRFLHLLSRESDANAWQEATEREVTLALDTASATRQFAFPGSVEVDGAVVRRQHAIRGLIEARMAPTSEGLCKLVLRVANLTEASAPPGSTRDAASLQALISTHAIVYVRDGEFVSLTDPPPPYREAAKDCHNVGVWPVLVGPEGSHDCMLASPIILADYPQVAPESPGNLFDGAEIDEILSLRILTMTDAEKAEMRHADERTRRVLERTESLDPRQWMNMHGALRNPASNVFDEKPPIESVKVFGVELKRGDRVRLWPQKSADIMDIALKGQVAEIESIESDLEDGIQLAVVLENDPGRDLGALRQPGHRFFFSPEEVEPLENAP